MLSPRCVPLPARFLHYEPFNHPKYFKKHIKEEIAHNPTKGFKKLQTLLRAVLLRRTKGSKIGDEPIICLPERRQQLVQVEFSRDEAAFYKQVGAWGSGAGFGVAHNMRVTVRMDCSEDEAAYH